jgi:hypothetical protein
MSANERPFLVDTSGEIPEDKPFRLSIRYVEPAFYSWWQARTSLLTV